MPHLKPPPLLAATLTICIGVTILFVLGSGLLPAWAAPLFQFPLNSVTVTSGPAPPAGQFVERTLLRDSFLDPSPDWRQANFNDSSWDLSYLAATQPAWGTPVGGLTPSTDFIWGGPPGTAAGGGLFFIPNNPDPQYLFVRKNFCIPLNADPGSVSAASPLYLQIATTAQPSSNGQVAFNGVTAFTGLTGAEDGSYHSLDFNAWLGTAPGSVRRVSRNTVAIRVRDDVDDSTAALAYGLTLNYSLDPAALTINSSSNPAVVGQAVTFSQSNNGLGGNGPFTFQWDFGDGTTSTAGTPAKTYSTTGLYTTTLTMTDTFGCPSAPVTLAQRVVPQVSFSSPTYSTTEGAGVAVITVRLNATAPWPVTVDYSATDGTATAPPDYSSTAGSLTFPAGVTSQTFSVPIVNDNLDEGPETVNLSLSNANNAVIGLGSATLTINEGGGAPPPQDSEDDDDDGPQPTLTPTPTLTPIPTPSPTPEWPAYLPETGLRGSSSTAKSAAQILVVSVVVGVGGFTAWLAGRRWRKRPD